MLDVSAIEAARTRLAPHIVRTPLLNSPRLDRELGAEVFIKAECLQKTGSFKFRGALNKILQLSGEQIRRGVVAYTSGNHGGAVAAAAAIAGAPATIVLPSTAPAVKVENCRWWGAEIVTYDPLTERREDVARPFVEERGLTLVPPFDDEAIMAGQGTIGREISEQLGDKQPDIVVAPCSGGGLSSGVFTGVRHASPEVACVIVEARGYAKMARSLEMGSATGNPQEAKTVMDALSGRLAGERPFQVLRQLQARAVAISDDEAVTGVCAAFHHLKLVVEAGGAAALAALIAGKIDFAGKRVVVVCSGGNVNRGAFADMLQQDREANRAA